MADYKYNAWSVQQLQDEILRVRMINLEKEQELCFTLTEKAKLKNDHSALAFSYTFLADYYLAIRHNKECIAYLSRAKLLSEAMHYDELLVRIYNFYGMLCNSIYDEITALDYYLKCLDTAVKLDDVILMATAYNNIATCFDLKHNYIEAINYYQKSYDLLRAGKKNTAYSKAVSLTNLCNCSFKLQRLKDVQRYLACFQSIDQKEFVEGMELLYEYCKFLVGYLKKDTSCYRLADGMLDLQKRVENRLLVHQIITNICDLFLDRDECSYAQSCLEILADINKDDDLKSKKELQKLIVKYNEKFCSKEEQRKAYRDFYKIILAIEDMETDDYSAGLSAKMELYRSKAVQVDLEKENQLLEKLMSQDDLTQISNRRCFNNAMTNPILMQADIVAIAMLDIDYFKEYNDMYGHQMGDQALIEVGNVLRSIEKSGHIRAYRYGGDEFSIIFLNQCEDEVKRILQLVKARVFDKKIPHAASHTGSVLSLSCGYAITHDKGGDFTQLLKEADTALYKSKELRVRR